MSTQHIQVNESDLVPLSNIKRIARITEEDRQSLAALGDHVKPERFNTRIEFADKSKIYEPVTVDEIASQGVELVMVDDDSGMFVHPEILVGLLATILLASLTFVPIPLNVLHRAIMYYGLFVVQAFPLRARCACNTRHLGKGNPLRVSRCIPSGPGAFRPSHFIKGHNAPLDRIAGQSLAGGFALPAPIDPFRRIRGYRAP